MVTRQPSSANGRPERRQAAANSAVHVPVGSQTKFASVSGTGQPCARRPSRMRCRSDRTFTCDACGLVPDRDLNAALNLKQFIVRSGREMHDGRGADQKTPPGAAGSCKASTPHRL
jgi:Putative transposase DNA-binding domain